MSDANAVIKELAKYVRAKRHYVVSYAGIKDFEFKDDKSVVTKIDNELEADARKIIRKFQPDAGINGEEYGIEGDAKTFWTLDPIDGTAYFIRDLPEYMFMAAYVENDKPKMSLMYNFALDEMYMVGSDGVATKNGQPIRVSDREFNINAYIEMESHLDHSAAITEKFAQKELFLSLPYWRSGYGLCLVAEGKIEAKLNFKPYGKLYDFLPGQILIKAAGGDVVNIGSDTWDWRDLNTISSNGIVTKNLQELMLEFGQ